MPEPPEKKFMVSLNWRSHIQPVAKGSVSSYWPRYVCSSGMLSQESSSARAAAAASAREVSLPYPISLSGVCQ